MKILYTGGSGLLGKYLSKFIDFEAPSHTEFDITRPETLKGYPYGGGGPEIVIHAAAYTDVPKAEIEKDKCFAINVTGTFNMIKAFPEAYFVYISSEQVKIPTNFYLYTKLWGEEIVKAHHKKYLIIRTLFKDNPFPYKEAFINQWTCGDSVDIIAPMIAKEVMLAKVNQTIDVVTERKTIFELARRTRPDIRGILVEDVKNVKLPTDYI